MNWNNIVLESFDGEKIFSQLGGKYKLSSMIGATDFVISNKQQYSQFKFKGSTKYSYCVIYLTPKDTYNLRLYKLVGVEFKNDKMIKDVHAGELIETFENETGLKLKL